MYIKLHVHVLTISLSSVGLATSVILNLESLPMKPEFLLPMCPLTFSVKPLSDSSFVLLDRTELILSCIYVLDGSLLQSSALDISP